MNYFIVGGDGKRYGPKPELEIRAWIREGRLNAESNVAAEGTADWKPLSEFPEFAADLAPTGTPVAPAAPATPQPVPQPAPAAPAPAPQPAPQPAGQPGNQPYPQYAAAPAGSQTNSMALAGLICSGISILAAIAFLVLGIAVNLGNL